jgi:Flp pilus assembly protein TadG
MRVVKLVRDERGIAGTMLIVAMVFIVALMALVFDGGLLFVQRRHVVNAADAAALAAAQAYAHNDAQCGGNDGPAQTQADSLAATNYSGVTRIVYQTDCARQTVKVGYQANVGGLFSSGHFVSTKASAAWGVAGGAQNVIPLGLSMGRLSNCNIPNGVTVGAHCYFWWDNGNTSSGLSNAEWGLMDLRSWGPPYLLPAASCSGYQASQALVTQWMHYGFSGNLVLRNPGPTYVCRSSGSQGNALNNDINNFTAGKILAMPVNDPSRQVDSAGTLCPPGGTCSVDKYAIVGFGALEIHHAYSGQSALTNCGSPPFAYQNAGNLRCLDTIWQGYQEGGINPGGGGGNFGLIAITLSG